MGYLYFPAPPLCLAHGPDPGPQFVFTCPGPQIVFTGPGPKFVFTGPGAQFVFTGPGSKFLFTRLGQSEAWACRYQSCPPNLYLLALAYDFITVLWICIYLLIYSSSSGSSIISNGNFLGLHNTNISMPILVN